MLLLHKVNNTVSACGCGSSISAAKKTHWPGVQEARPSISGDAATGWAT